MNTINAPAAAGGKRDYSFPTRSFGEAYIITDLYHIGGKLSVELEDSIGELIASLSVNIPEKAHLLGSGEFFAKTWTENEEIAEDALESGIFRDTGRTSADALNAPIWAFN